MSKPSLKLNLKPLKFDETTNTDKEKQRTDRADINPIPYVNDCQQKKLIYHFLVDLYQVDQIILISVLANYTYPIIKLVIHYLFEFN